MDNWTLFHRYRRLVKNGTANPLLCPDCGTPVTMAIGPDDEPLLRCLVCPVIWQPGGQFYADLRAVVSEHFVD